MHFLLVCENRDFGQMVSFAIESKLKAQVTTVFSFLEAMDYLLHENPIQLILCDDADDKGRLLKFLSNSDSKVPCIVLVQKKNPISPEFMSRVTKCVNIMQSPTESIQQIQQAILELIQAGVLVPDNESTNLESQFCRIPAELLVKVVPLKGDIFIRLSDIKFVKLFQQGDTFDAKDLNSFLATRNIHYLFVKKENCDEFIEKIKSDLAAVINQDKLPPSEMPLLAQSMQELVGELSLKLGFTQGVQAIVNENVKNVVTAVRKQPQLNKVFSYMTENPQKYIPAHSVMTTHMACYLAIQLGWSSDFTMEKLTFAGFLHDVTLKNPQLASLRNLSELEQCKERFSEAEIQSYLLHPTDASKICRHFESVPVDVDTIISQHHEGNEKDGFPRKYGLANVSPLAAVFIVAHEVVENFIKKREPAEFLAEMNEKYKISTFKKIMKCIHKDELLNAINKI